MLPYDESDKKREYFHQTIRRRAIEKIMRSKREMHFQQMLNEMKDKQDMELYDRIMGDSSELFKQGANYLQILREALNSQKSPYYKPKMQDIVQNLIKYYCRHYEGASLVLFFECLALIYCQTNIQSVNLTQEVVRICHKELKQSYRISDHSQYDLQIRCLVTLENITCYSDALITKYIVEEQQVLETIQCLLEDYPLSNPQKLHIICFYGNILEELLLIENNSHIEIVRMCCEENYDAQILEKGIEILLVLMRHDWREVVREMEGGVIIDNLARYEGYVKMTEHLVGKTCQQILENGKYLAEGMEMAVFINKIFEVLLLITNPNYDIDSPHCLAKSYHSISIVLQQHCLSTEGLPHKLQQAASALMNYWVEMEDDCPKVQTHLLFFIDSWVHSPDVVEEMVLAGKANMNSMDAPLWELIMEFMKMVDLDGEKSMLYGQIMSSAAFRKHAMPAYFDVLVQKLEGCCYCNDLQLERCLQLWTSENDVII